MTITGGPRLPGLPLAVMALVTLAYCTLWIPQGLDITDDGFHLTNQQALLQSHWLPRPGAGNGLFWLSDVIGAAWMALTGTGLLGARAGWALLTVVTAALAFRILTRTDAPWRVCIAMLLAVPMLLARSRMLIDYNGVPIVFLLLAINAWVDEATGQRRVRRDVLAGAWLALATLSRLPAGVGLLLLVPVPGAPREGYARRLVAALSGYAAVLLVMGSATVAAGRPAGETIGSYQQEILTLDDSHLPPSLLMVNVRDAVATVAAAVVLFVLLAGLVRSTTPHTRAPRTVALAFTAIAGATLIVLLAVAPDHVRWAWPLLLTAACLAVAAWLRFGSGPMTSLDARRLGLLCLGLIAALAVCVGSNAALGKVTHGLWLALPAAMLCVSSLAARRGASGVVLTIAGVLALSGFLIRVVSPYRDAPDRRLLVASIDDASLRGIRTTAQRAQSIDEVVDELARRVAPGDRLLAFGSIPFVHYVTRTEPALEYAWPDELSIKTLSSRLDAMGTRRPMPALAVSACVDTTSPWWGSRKLAPARLKQRAMIIDWLAAHDYVVVWANAEFEIRARRDPAPP